MTAAITPRQLAARSILGSWLVYSLAPLIFLCVPIFRHLGHETGLSFSIALAWRVALLVSPAIVGFTLIYSNEKKLKAGLSEDRWPEAQLAEARDWLSSPTPRLLPLAAAGALLASFAFVLITNHHAPRGLATFSYIIVVPSATYARVKAMFAKPLPYKPAIDWSAVKPLHSTHWGAGSGQPAE